MEFPEIPLSVSVASHLPAGAQVYNQNFLMPPRSLANRIHPGGRQGIYRNPHPQPQVMEDMKPTIQSHPQTTPFAQPSQESHRAAMPVTSGVDYHCSMEAMNHSPRQSTTSAPVNAHTHTESDIDSDDESKESVVSSQPSGSQPLQHKLDPLKGLEPADQLKYLKNFSKELLQQALDCQSQNTDDPNDSSHLNPKPNTACSTCEKTFNRPCELRKHNKRHEKPYGCTWPECSRTFGSKNDWKRHETNQHGQIESWHCPHDCRKISNSRGSFHIHLQKDHKITDGTLLERNIEESRQNSHSRNSFWCGFCNEHQTTTPGEYMSVANQRFDHIDNHFMGRSGWKKSRIEEWQYVEEAANQNDQSILKKIHLSEAEGDAGRKSKRQRAN